MSGWHHHSQWLPLQTLGAYNAYFNVKAGLPLRIDSNKVGQVLLGKDIKEAGRFRISPNVVPFESIIKEYPALKKGISKKISLPYSILLSNVNVAKDIKN